MINIIKGNLLNSKEEIIGHQVNCKGVMNSGVAKAIREKYHYAYTQYKAYCKIRTSDDLLGQCNIVMVANSYLNSEKKLYPRYIANMFAQDDYGYNKCYTDYKAFEMCIKHLVAYMDIMDIKTIAMPYRIGCGRGGGDWNIVYGILDKYFGQTNKTKLVLYDNN